MKLFCRHDWDKITETYVEPCLDVVENVSGGIFGGAALVDMLEKMACGVTTVLLRCKKCKKLRRVAMLGKNR